MKRAAHFFDHPDVDPEERDTVLRPRPSHVTKAQAARILGVTRSAILSRVRYQSLPVELWWDLEMIPMPAVQAILDKKGRRHA